VRVWDVETGPDIFTLDGIEIDRLNMTCYIRAELFILAVIVGTEVNRCTAMKKTLFKSLWDS
jgi:hypothetical protein